jgi:parallel beta-helix repeat protein
VNNVYVGGWPFYSRITNNVIANKGTGIYLYRSVAEISGNHISGGSTGIRLYDTDVIGDELFLYDNIIERSINWAGVYLYSSSSVHFGNNQISRSMEGIYSYYSSADLSSPVWDDDDLDGYNVIRDNCTGISAYRSHFNMGYYAGPDSDYGGNTIENVCEDIWAFGYSRVWADMNYWGSDRKGHIVKDSGSRVSSNYPLSSPPAGVQNEELPVSAETPLANNNKANLEQKINRAKKLFHQKEYLKSAELCEKIIAKNPDATLAYAALDIMLMARKNDKYQNASAASMPALKTFIANGAAKKTPKMIYAQAELQLAVESEKNQLKELNALQTKYKDHLLMEDILFAKFMYFFNEAEDLEKAERISQNLKQKFPKSELYVQTQRFLGKEDKDLENFAKSRAALGETPTLETESLPTKYELLGNYPNPFNPQTKIPFHLPQASQVTIEVYNTLGQLVATPANGIFEAGRHKVVFNGASFASGLYIVRAQMKSKESGAAHHFVHKMILLK